MSGRGLLRNVR
jgi:LysR substrate binding domain